ncbi:MAG: hypothetical protein LC745_13185, partial [Planctomycetia bacterium]|nr:hypothetical protein [Planctomycetia bacterium]
ADQGAGLDQAGITITTPSYVKPRSGARPGLEVAGVAVDSPGIKWGQSFQVGATLENAGGVDPGPFRVRYLLVGNDGTLGNSLFLADTTVNGLAPGGSPQNILTTLKLPASPPAAVNAQGIARVAVIIDPENTIDEPRTNAANVSSPIQLQVVGTDGQLTVPVVAASKAVATTAATAAPKTSPAAKPAAKAVSKTTNAVTPKPSSPPHRRVTAKPAKHTFEHNLKVFPNAIYKYYKKTFHK